MKETRKDVWQEIRRKARRRKIQNSEMPARYNASSFLVSFILASC